MPNAKAVPIQTRPTPVKADTLFWEDLDGETVDAVRLEYGTPYPDTQNFPDFFLCKEERLSQTQARRWWSREYEIQDTYNDQESYAEQATAYPIFERRYCVLRSKYQSLIRTELSTLLGVTVVRVTAGGSGYNSAPDVTPSGGTGTGGVFTALINKDGEVEAVAIVESGTYSVAPTLTFTGGDGNGAAATALIQPQTAFLVHQDKQEFADEDPRRSIFVIQRCVYETLPGPQLVSDAGYDEETGAKMFHIEQRVIIADTTVPSWGDEYLTDYFVMNARMPVDEKNRLLGTLIIDLMAQPDSREEKESGNYQPPDLFVPIPFFSNWPIPAAFPGCPVGPYQNRLDGLDFAGNPLPGDVDHRGTYELQVATPVPQLTNTYSYFIPPIPDLPAAYEVTSQPGKFLPITRNTIHGAITEVVFNGGDSVVIENLRASTPSTYVSGSQVIAWSQKQWKGPFYRRVVTTCVFPTLPNE